jgi:tetratricopeptide (TPR) repeat protein
MRLLILPVAQNLDYDYPVYTSFFQTQVLASLALIIALLGYGFYLLKTSQKNTCRFPALLRISGFAILWFFITLSIESGMVPLIDTIFEHRLYLPSVWFFISIAVVIAELYQGSKTRKQFVATATVILIAISGYATYQRNNLWRDRSTLWADVVKKAPNNVRALTNLGKSYVDILDPATAIPLLERAVFILPNYSPAHYALGLAFIQRGDPERALEHFVTTTKLAPNYSKGWEEAGRLLLERGDGDAVFFMRQALKIDPNAFSSQEKACIFGKF